jgi:hypothetical protein
MLAHIPFPFGRITQLAPGLAVKPNFALLVYAGYQAYYFLLEPIGAVSLSQFQSIRRRITDE